MEISNDSINWIISGIVGVASSIIGAFIFWGFQNFAAKRSSKRHIQKLEDLKKQKEELEKLYENPSELLIHYLGILFYILFASFLGTAVGYIRGLFIIDFSLNLIRLGLYIGAALYAMKAFLDLAKLKKFDKIIPEMTKKIESLEASSLNKKVLSVTKNDD